MAASSNGSNAGRVHTNETVIIDEGGTRKVHVNAAATTYIIMITKRRVDGNTRRADANVMATANEPAKRRVDGNTRRVDANVAVTASELTKKRADTKIVATTNEMVIANINELANNARKVHANVVATADVNVTSATNKVTSNIKKHVPMYRRLQIPI